MRIPKRIHTIISFSINIATALTATIQISSTIACRIMEFLVDLIAVNASSDPSSSELLEISRRNSPTTLSQALVRSTTPMQHHVARTNNEIVIIAQKFNDPLSSSNLNFRI